MKKILLATTILTMTAGVASAEITWGGTAKAGIASNGLNNGGAANPNGDADETFAVYNNFNLAMTASGATDSGLTFGATFDTTAGKSYDLADDDGFDDEGGTFGNPKIFIKGSFGEINFKRNGLDYADGDASDDATVDGADDAVDVSYSGTFGQFTVGVAADVDSQLMGASVAFAPNDKLSLSADFQQNVNTANVDLWNVSASYAVSSALKVTLTAGNDETAVGTNVTNESLKLAYTGSNGVTASAKYNTSDDSVDIAAGYSANGLSVSAETNTVSNEWKVTGGYDLGGGLSLEAGTNYTGDMMLGAKMSF